MWLSDHHKGCFTFNDHVLNTFEFVLLSLGRCILKRCNCNSNSGLIAITKRNVSGRCRKRRHNERLSILVRAFKRCDFLIISIKDVSLLMTALQTKSHRLKVRTNSDTIRSSWRLFRHFPGLRTSAPPREAQPTQPPKHHSSSILSLILTKICSFGFRF